MKFKSFDGSKEIDLLNCPFCGAEPVVIHSGNNHTKKCAIKIKCPTCRVERTDAALKFGLSWLEDIVVKNWNQRI